MPEGQSLYVISDGAGNVKVGVGMNPRRRLRQLQTGNARCLVLRRQAPFAGGDPVVVERYVHWLLREHHVGGEWFSVDEQVALGALMAAGIAVIKGLRVPRPGFGGPGRDQLWTERLNVTLPTGAKDRIKAALLGEEDSLDFAREAISDLLERRGHARLPDPKKDKSARPARAPRPPG